MDIDIPFSDDRRGLSLCYRCKRISLGTVVVPGGLYHSNGLEDVIESARQCAMCALIRDGLLADIADKFQHDTEISHDMITVQPDVYNVSIPGHRSSFQAGLRIWSIESHLTCMFNWYLPYNETISSPVRPKGLQKLDFAKLWLRQSLQSLSRSNPKRKHHGSMNKSSFNLHATSFPTRVLDLGFQQYDRFGNVRLVRCHSEIHYISLSHRWGGSQHLTTTRGNYRQHEFGIRFAELPKTFQDAITVARYLGIRYLWIDALCIIQDDKTDWHREALLMGKVYQGATCTIAVHDAPDDSAGFLENALRAPVSVSLGSIQNDTDSTVSLRSNFRAAVDKSELSRRGWVLQERFLSTRTLHFTENSIFFEDRNGVITEEDAPTVIGSRGKFLTAPTESNSVATSWTTTSLNHSADVPRTAIPMAIGTGSSWNQSGAEDKGVLSKNSWPRPEAWLPKAYHIRPFNFLAWTSNSEDYDSQWFELLERYSDTKLTFESDKLPAISGLVKFLQRHTGDCFISGIWGRTFYIGLLWAALRSPLRRPKIRRAASWSWVSNDGRIQHPRLSEYRPKIAARLDMDVSIMRGVFIDTACPLTLHAKMRRLDRLEPATAGEGPLFFRRSVHVHRMFGTKRFRPLIWFSPEKIKEEQQKCTHHIGPVGFAVLDHMETTHREPSDIWCVNVARSGDERNWVLLVVPSPSALGHWRRVGMGAIEREINEKPWFSDVPTAKLTLE